MQSVEPTLTKQWRVGTLTFLVVLALCAISIWQRQTRHNLVCTFSVHTISQRMQLPTSSAVNPQNIMDLLHLLLEQRSLHAAIIHRDGSFTITMDSIPAHSTERVQQDLSAIYQELIEHLGKGIDPAPLSAQLDSLDAQLDLIANTLQSTALSDYERYELEHRSLLMKAQRKELRGQVDVVSTGIFSPPTIRLYRAEQMDRGVLLLLSLILSGFIAAATMVLAHSLRSNT